MPPPFPPFPPQPPQPPRSTGLVVGLAVAGFFAYIMINFVVVIVVLMLASPASLVAGTVFLAVLALGGGVTLLLLRRPWAKGLGLGLMIGWGLVSIVTAGFCTGLNPSLYA
jgi:hypothetical protein